MTALSRLLVLLPAVTFLVQPTSAQSSTLAPTTRTVQTTLLMPRAGFADAALTDRSETLVASWAVSDTAPTAAAFAPSLHSDATALVTHLVRALTRRHGAIQHVAAESSGAFCGDQTAVVVRVRFERGAERFRLIWTTGPAPVLRSIARAAPERPRASVALAPCEVPGQMASE